MSSVVMYDPCDCSCEDGMYDVLMALKRLLEKDDMWKPGGMSLGQYDYQVEEISLEPDVYAKVVYYMRHGKPSSGDYDRELMSQVYSDLGWVYQ